MLILVADGDFRMIFYHFGKKMVPCIFFSLGIEIEGHIGSGRFRPRNFKHAVRQFNDIGRLIRYPTAGYHAAVNAVVDRVVVFGVPFVLPAVIVGVNKMSA